MMFPLAALAAPASLTHGEARALGARGLAWVDEDGTTRTLASLEHPAIVYLLQLAPGSRRVQAGALNRVARWLGLNFRALTFPWHELKPVELVGLRSWLAETYAPNTANRMLCAVRGVLRVCATMRLLSRDDAAELVSVAKVKGSRGLRGRSVDAQELAALFAAVDQTSPLGRRDGAMLALLYGCGLRRAELCALDLEDVSDAGLRVIGKGDHERTVPLPSSVRATLGRWIWELSVRRDTRARRELFPCVHPGPGGAMRGRMSAVGVYSRIRTLAKRAGIPGISPHDLRRSYVSDLLDRKVDLATVQALVGHSDPVTTARYDRRPARARAEAVEVLSVPEAPARAEGPA